MPVASLRYTGDFPPPDVLHQFPNWEYALDEEGIDGQDETTIRPCNEQRWLTPDVAFSAGWVTQANGDRLPAMLEIDQAKIGGLTVYQDAQWAWSVRLLGRPAKWESVSFDWLPESERRPTVSLTDSAVFPLMAESHVPADPGGSALRILIARAG